MHLLVLQVISGGGVSLNSPRSLVTSCDIKVPAGMLPGAAMTLQRQQEAALQRVLEEEILKEMTRENALQQVGLSSARNSSCMCCNCPRCCGKQSC